MAEGLLARTRRARLAVLLAVLAGLAAYRAWQEVAPAFRATPWDGRLELAHGVVVARERVLVPPCTLVVARVPRGAGLRLRAGLLAEGAPSLETLGPRMAREGALAAINGDYHRLSGPCFATTFSTLADQGALPVIGAPFTYACALWVERSGAVHVGDLDVTAHAVLPSGRRLQVVVNVETADDLLITRPPPGTWDAEGLEGVPLERVDATTFRVAGAPTTRFAGPALLRRGGWSDDVARELAPGAALRLEVGGRDAARVFTAVGTGPRLLEGGRVAAVLATEEDPGWATAEVRAAIGVTPTHVVLAASDHLPGFELTLEELARALARLGVTDAVALDGGPSPALWAGGRVLNQATLDDPGAGVASAVWVLPPDPTGVEPGVR